MMNISNFLNGRNNIYSIFIRSYAKSTKTPAINKFRNIGIIAHVDAGKTTTCERMLYYSGITDRCGDIDSGDTVLDFLDMERERGITITSAVITLPWKKHTINVIDTPGHVDFTIEVERSVRVLDGAIVIIDAVSGVQAQTETVWAQAKRNEVPAIVFINKMDRDGASFSASISSLEKRLYINALPIQLPVSSGKNFGQIIDLINMEVMEWDDDDFGFNIERTPISDDVLLARATSAREKLLESIANSDEEFMDLYLTDSKSVTSSDIKEALKRLTRERKGVVVVCGSSLKNKGVHPILDSVVDYLPSPVEKKSPEAYNEEGEVSIVNCDENSPLCALAFKVVNDKKKGMITYIRVYSGTLKSAQKLLNSNVNQAERPMQLFRIKADDIDAIQEVKAGDIAGALGLKYTRSGDTLVDHSPSSISSKLKLRGMNIPKPVFFSSIFPDQPSYEMELKKILENIQLEDPSIEVTNNSETGQQLVCAQGELHMEIIKDRLFNHYKAKATMGDLEIAYRSTIGDSITKKFTKSLTSTGGKLETVSITLSLSHSDDEESNLFTIDPNFDLNGLVGENKKMIFEVKEALNLGASDAFRNGIFSGFQFHGVTITMTDLEFDTGCSVHTLRTIIWMAILHISKETNPVLLEPIMNVDIQVSESQLRNVISDFSGRRRGTIYEQTADKHSKFLKGRAPLKELLGYASDLRSMTKGTGFFSMEFEGYHHLPEKLKKQILEKHGFFSFNSNIE